MTHAQKGNRSRSNRRGRLASFVLSITGLASGLSLVGCEMDSFIDPSVVGRWENTPIIVPILDRIDSIESDTGEFVEISQVRPEDLVVEASAYRIGAGDVLQAQIYAIDQEGARTPMELLVDPTGAINIPQVGRVVVLGLTSEEAERAVARAMFEAGVVGEDFGRNTNPVLIQVVAARQLTYSIFGAVRVPSRFQIPYPDYRLLEALTDAGGISPTQKYVYVIRQVPLNEATDAAVGGSSQSGTTPRPTTRPTTPAQTTPNENILDVIDRLTEPESNPGAASGAGQQPPIGMSALAGSGSSGSSGTRFIPYENPQAIAIAQNSPTNAPPIDLIDDGYPSGPAKATGPIRVDLPSESPYATPGSGDAAADWRFVDGRWRKVLRTASGAPAKGGKPEGQDPLESGSGDAGLMTQRVIQVPVAPLLQGAPQYNIVVRPQDVISVPPAPSGYVFLGGQIARPGVFTIEPISELTLQRAMVTAGGMNAIGIPERVDLIRRVGDNKQAVIRLNSRAIWEGTQPDILLKPDDVLNFGTNFWATPLAVIRGGFRASYGFGFLLDRNFGNDVFGAPPSNVGGR